MPNFHASGDEEAIWRLAMKLAGASTLEDFTRAVALEGGAAAAGRFAHVGLVDAASGRVRVLHHPEVPDFSGPEWATLDLDAAVPMCAAIREGSPVFLPSEQEIAHRFPEVMSVVADAGLRAWATVPLVSSSEAILGAIGFGWDVPQPFTPYQRRSLELVAQLVAHGLERSVAQRVAPPVGPGRSRFEVGTPISPHIAARWFRALYETPVMFSGMLGADGIVLDANRTSVEGCGLDRSATVGRPFWEGGWWSPDPALADKVRGWCERVVATGESMIEPTEFFVGDGSRRIAQVALYPMGDDREEGGPVTHVLALGLDVTDAAEARLERERRQTAEADLLRRESESKARDLALSQEAGRFVERRLTYLAGAALDLARAETFEDVVSIVVEQGVAGLGAATATIVVPDGDQLRYGTSDPGPDGPVITIAALARDNPFPATHVLRTGERLVFPDSAAGRAFGPVMDAVYAERGRHAWVFTPLSVGQARIGALSISWTEERPITTGDLDLIEAFGAQIAQSLQRIRLAASERESALRILRMVESLQQSLLTLPPTPPGIEVAATYLPAVVEAQVGGDWYDVFTTTSGSTVISVGDVAGHDGDAAAEMAQLRNLMRGLAVDAGGDPSDLLSRLDRAIEHLGLGVLATALVVEIGPLDGTDGRDASRQVRWSNAGHLPLFARLPSGEVRQLDGAHALPLGIDASAPRSTDDEGFPAGTLLILCTDGLVERRQVILTDGLDRLARILEGLETSAPADVCDRIINGMLPEPPGDDVALLVCRLGG